MSVNWLWPALAIEDSIPSEMDLAAADAVDLAANLIDGPAWLREARFSSICYGILFARADDPQPMKIRRRELKLSTCCRPDRLRSGAAAVRWMFFIQVLNDLEKVGERYGLSNPPLRISPHDASDLLDAQLPFAGSGRADVSAKMAAMEDDEVLVAVPSELPDEDRAAATARLTRTEEAVSRLLGPSRAGSTSGEAYVWAFPLPK